jgi:hypothetical protein
LFISDLGELVSFRGLLLETAMSRSVYRLPADDRTNGWSALLGTRQPKAPLQGDVAVDWVIVGAGYAGLAAARQLAQQQPDASIAVVDAGVVGRMPRAATPASRSICRTARRHRTPPWRRVAA